MPKTAPNALPQSVFDWREWRETYNEYVTYYRQPSSLSPEARELQLRARLMRLGFIGVNLEAELTYIKNGGN